MKTLADKICEAAADRKAPAFSRALTAEAADAIKSAERFRISEEIRDATHDLLVGRPSSLLEACAFARPPFERVWIEWDTPDQPPPIASIRVKTVQIGAMVETIPNSNGKAFSFWTAWGYDINDNLPERMRAAFKAFGEPPPDEAEMAYLEEQMGQGLGFSSLMLGVDFDHMDRSDPSHFGKGWFDPNADNSIEGLTKIRNDETNGVRYALRSEKERQALIRINNRVRWGFRQGKLQASMLAASHSFGPDGMRAAMDDVRDECGPVISAMILMNSRNCIDLRKVEPPPGLVKARLKRGNKPPPLSYSTVHIRLGQADERAAVRYGASDEEIRRHKVRGHFKARKSGVYWWRPFMRGSLDAGTVERAGYVVSA